LPLPSGTGFLDQGASAGRNSAASSSDEMISELELQPAPAKHNAQGSAQARREATMS
jgi:hypothetical protein